jgi:hypothetical protein
MPIQEPGLSTNHTTDIIDLANPAIAAPQPQHHEHGALKGDPDNPSKKEAEALAALEAILPADAFEWVMDEEHFERTFGFPMSRERAAAALTDLLDAGLPRPEHRAPLQTLVRLLRYPDGVMGGPFSSFGYISPIQPYLAYLAGLRASRGVAAGLATAIVGPMNMGVEVELFAGGLLGDIDTPEDWALDPDDNGEETGWFAKGAQRVAVRLDDPKQRALAEAFIRAFFGKKTIYMRSPKWQALTEWRHWSHNGEEWLVDIARKAPSLQPALRLGTPEYPYAMFPADADLAELPGNLYESFEDDRPPLIRDPLKRELNAEVTDLIRVPFTVSVRGVDFETRLVRQMGVVNNHDEDGPTPTPGALVKATILDDLARADIAADKEGAGGKSTRAMAALSAAGAEFFNSPNGRLWVSFGGKVYRVSDTDGCPAIMAWLVKNDLAPSRTAKAELLDLMAGAAVSGPTHDVHFRQAQMLSTEPAAYINLMDLGGRGVVIDASGWRVAPVASLPLRMADRPKARPLPVPEHAGDGLTFLERFVRHVKLPAVINASDPADAGLRSRAAILTTLVAQFFRPGAVPHVFVSGPEGASKTTTAKRLKSLVDPDSVPLVTSMPKEAGDLFLLAEQQPLLVIDNASSIQEPDIVAALATGAGHQKRQFYTDSERTVYEAKSSLVFTSIVTDITQRPDLMDRVLPVTLRPMAPAERKLEADLDKAWSRDLPFLLADLLDLVAAAIANSGKVRFAVDAGLLPPLPRLADAAILAEAAAQAEGWTPGLLLDVLNATRDTAKADQLEANPVAVRVRALLDANAGQWSGTTTELLGKLRVEEGPPWGREVLSVHTLAKALDRIVASLPVWGIEVARGDRSKSARTLTISRTAAPMLPTGPDPARAG